MDYNRVRLVFAAKAFCGPQWQWRNTGRSELLNLWYVAEGIGDFRQDSHHCELMEGTCLLIREWVPHVASHAPSHRLTVPFVQFQYLDGDGEPVRPADGDIIPELRLLPERTLFAGLMDRCVDAWSCGDRDAAQHWLVSCLREVARQDAIAMGTAEPHQRSIVDNAAGLMEKYPERQWSVARMAEMAGYSLDHFIRLFKRFHGTTPGNYQIRCRIAAAMNLLRFGNSTIGEIADELGYPDVYCFSRQFSKVMGRPPSSFRK